MAKANDVNVYHYITFLFEYQPNERMSDEELENLASWNETVKAEIQKRAEKQLDGQEEEKKPVPVKAMKENGRQKQHGMNSMRTFRSMRSSALYRKKKDIATGVMRKWSPWL